MRKPPSAAFFSYAAGVAVHRTSAAASRPGPCQSAAIFFKSKDISMFVFEIVKPGFELVHSDPNWARRTSMLLEQLIVIFYDANVALNHFVESRNRPHTTSREMWESDLARQQELTEEIIKELGGYKPDIGFEARLRLKHEKWSQGIPPQTFELRTKFMYARSFLYALDNFERFLGMMSVATDAPAGLGEIHLEIAKAFPNLREVRNTQHHLEDRFLGIGARKKPLELKHSENTLFSGKMLALTNLNGSKFGSTMADGHYGEVDVSVESMETLQHILTAVLNSFVWDGREMHYPL